MNRKQRAIRSEKYLKWIYSKLCISNPLQQHRRIVFPVLTELAGVIPECIALPTWTLGLCCGGRRSEGSEAGCSRNEFILPVWLGVCEWRMKARCGVAVRHEWRSDWLHSLFPEKRAPHQREVTTLDNWELIIHVELSRNAAVVQHGMPHWQVVP